jgi:hypothetical protein
VIGPEQATEIDARLAEAAGVSVEVWREYISGNIRAGAARRTGWRFARGTHGGTYVPDPEGMDILPTGYSIPSG